MRRGLRFAGYARVSTHEQAERGVSLADQRHLIKHWCKAHEHTLVAMRSDNGISGTVAPSDRPALRRCMQLVARGESDGIVFTRIDRVSRDALDILRMGRDARKRGWHIAAVQDPLDTTTDIGEAMLGFMGVLAQLESRRASARTRSALAHLAVTGRCISRWAPFGYRLGAPDGPWQPRTRNRSDDGRKIGAPDTRLLMPCPVEQDILAEIVGALDRDGEAGAADCARRLRERGVKNPRGNRVWGKANVLAVYRTAKRRQAKLAA